MGASYPQQFSYTLLHESKLGVKLEITQQLKDNEILCCAVLTIQLRNQNFCTGRKPLYFCIALVRRLILVHQ